MGTTTLNWCAVLSYGVDQRKSRDVQCLGHLHTMRITQVASTARLGWRGFCAMPRGGNGKLATCPALSQDTLGLDRVAIGAIAVNIKLTVGLSVVR